MHSYIWGQFKPRTLNGLLENYSVTLMIAHRILSAERQV